ncbi:MAG: twin-arginine translocase TatA/TatE family subunit [Wenzhouxiangella sp.]|jgi:sec-independent protein translocase protein TatA|nr:twin-arginine translocase TatA/TatE family subunit [Wenzhouxiangella sp.]
MGFGNIGWFQILVVLLIVLLVFGTKKIRGLGGDLGGAIRDFRKGMSEDDADSKDESDKVADDPAAKSDKESEKKSDKKAPKSSGDKPADPSDS